MKTRNLLIGAFALLLAGSVGHAGLQEGRVLTWPWLKEQGKLVSGAIQPVDTEGWQSLRVSNIASTPTRMPIVVLDDLSPTSRSFAIEGQVRSQGVEGEAYLEMWTVLPDGRRFFTRTLSKTGPMGIITGTSGWRAFALPFDLGDQLPKHVRLEINVFMPGPGIIDISPLRLVNLSPELPHAERSVWWSAGTGGWIGGLLGTFIGLMLPLIAILSQRGASRVLTKAMLLLVFAVGLACIVVGIAAVISRQPFAVTYPLLLGGVLTLALTSIAYSRLRRQWREVEFRRMQAMDTQ